MYKKAFTLAEVLITLAIIGIVAVLTIPNLIANSQNAQFKSGYKKALSSLTQAALMNTTINDYDFSELSEADNLTIDKFLTTLLKGGDFITDEYIEQAAETVENEDKILKQIADLEITGPKYTNMYGETSIDGVLVRDISTWKAYQLADGSVFVYKTPIGICTEATAINNYCVGFIDVNGIKEPNKVTICEDIVEKNMEKFVQSCKEDEINDIYPVVFYDNTVQPGSPSAKYISKLK